MAFWFALVFLLGLMAGSAAMWWLLDGRVVVPSQALQQPQAFPANPAPEPVEDVPDRMSLSAKRLVTDLEKKYEGVTSASDEEEAKPKRARSKRVRRPAPEDPA